MKNVYEYTMINQSPTLAVTAGVDIEDAQCKAVSLSDGKAVLPAAGGVPIGILLISSEDKIASGEEATIQFKDIGMWRAGAAVAAGDLLAADAEGLCQKATAGQYVFARALGAAAAKNDIVNVQIINAGYEKAGA